MKHGFLRVAAATPVIKVADCDYNSERIIELIEQAERLGNKLIVFPELCVTGYTCGDLFLQDTLLNGAMEKVKMIAGSTRGKEIVAIIGFPYAVRGKLYNTAAVLQGGKVLGLVPKMNIPNYTEFYEGRYFTPGYMEPISIQFQGEEVYFGSKILFECKDIPDFILGVEICEDLWVPKSPSVEHCIAGATIIANPSASDELTGKDVYRRELVKSQSGKLVCGYLYCDAGEGESTTDVVFAGHNLIAEYGAILAESQVFENGIISSEIDLGKLKSERRRMLTYFTPDSQAYQVVSYELNNRRNQLSNRRNEQNNISNVSNSQYTELNSSSTEFNGNSNDFDRNSKEENNRTNQQNSDLSEWNSKGYELPEIELTRYIDPAPFVPSAKADRDKRCKDIINIQAMGLKTRLSHIGGKCVVLGISGGLDSTLALLVAYRAFELLSLDKSGIISVTMPCFGTTDRTYNNAVELSRRLGVTLLEIPIRAAVEQHFKDIGHDRNQHDLTYENSQARERTQVLMDVASKYNGFVVGTGDMSELALGWATYNGDHMSMYGVNASVPKTLVRYLVSYFADTTEDVKLQEVLEDILDTPVSPELLPPRDGEISQKTEDIVGPYELHDFYLYYILRFGFTPGKVYHLAKIAFVNRYSEEVILKWLKVFYTRFFTQQFKRSCLPDGPKVGSVSVSPRGDLRMPSDASASLWMKELERL